MPRGVVTADSAYGTDLAFRDGVRALGLDYTVAIRSNTLVWPPGAKPRSP
ncbi:MAG: hypothetical protein HKN43_02935 [Rhodothermales bacterium]|nr:hypothetical protein [Rhodothermales bacterium]